MKGPHQVDIHHRLEILLGDFVEGPVTDVPGIVDQDVDAPVVIHGRLNNGPPPLGSGHRVRIGDSIATGRFDLLHHRLGRADIGALALHARTRIVDHDPGAFRGEQQRVFPTQAASGPRDHGHPVIEASFRHPAPRCVALSEE